MLIISGGVAILLAVISVCINGASAIYAAPGTVGISTLMIQNFFYGFSAVSLLLLSVSLEISHLKEAKENKGELGKADKLCLAFQVVAAIAVLATLPFINILFPDLAVLMLIILGAAIACAAIIIYFITRNTLCLSLLLWCIALQWLPSVLVAALLY